MEESVVRFLCWRDS